MGYKCAYRDDYAEASKYYKEALAENVNDPFIHNNLADVYMNLSQFDLAMEHAKEAIDKADEEVVPYVTLGQIHQTRGEHIEAVDCILRAQNILEEAVPELKDGLDSVEEVIRKLPPRLKFDVVNKDWIRIIYLVKSMKTNYQKERDYVRRGVSWEFLLDFRKEALLSVGSRYLWAKEKFGIKGNDAAAIANTYGAMSAIIGSPKVRIVENSMKRAVIQIPACWQHTVIKAMELDRDPGWVKCSYMCTEYINTVAKAINPNANFEFGSTLPDGHKYCEGEFKIQG